MAPQATPLTSTIATLLPNKYFTSGGQHDNSRPADGQQHLPAAHNNNGNGGAMDIVNGGTPHESILAQRPSITAGPTIKVPTIVMSPSTTTQQPTKAAAPKAPLPNGGRTRATFATPIQSKKGLPKGQRTDAPMLNYIFDSISAANKHHHHDHK